MCLIDDVLRQQQQVKGPNETTFRPITSDRSLLMSRDLKKSCEEAEQLRKILRREFGPELGKQLLCQ